MTDSNVEPPPGPRLSYITYTDSPDRAARDPNIRDIVRSNATRSAHATRGKRGSALPTSEPNPVRLEDSIGRFRIRPSLRQRRRTAPQPSKHQASIQSIPHLPLFEHFVSSLGARAWNLLHHYRYHFRNGSMAINAKKGWFVFAITNTATAHGMLALVSTDRDLAAGGPASPSTLYHRTAAMRHVRKLLARTSSEGKDILAGTVASLANSEILEGNMVSASAHMEGLMNIVQRNGGFQSFAENECVARLMAWADISYCSTWISPPKLPSLFNLRKSELRPCDCLLDSDTCKWEPIRTVVQTALLPSVVEAMDFLHRLPRSPPPNDAPTAERQRISRLLYTVERKLVEERDVVMAMRKEDSLSGMVHCTMRLFIARALRSLPRRISFIRDVEARLLYRLKHVRSPSFIATASREWLITLLWASLMSQEVELDTCVECAPSRLYIVWMMQRLKITNVEELTAVLTQMAWAQGFRRAILDSFFSESPYDAH